MKEAKTNIRIRTRSGGLELFSSIGSIRSSRMRIVIVAGRTDVSTVHYCNLYVVCSRDQIISWPCICLRLRYRMSLFSK